MTVGSDCASSETLASDGSPAETCSPTEAVLEPFPVFVAGLPLRPGIAALIFLFFLAGSGSSSITTFFLLGTILSSYSSSAENFDFPVERLIEPTLPK